LVAKKQVTLNKQIPAEVYLERSRKAGNIMKEFIPIEDGDYYLTPEGYRCFTEQYHLKRGYCCESNCRHCPYGFNKKRN